MAGDDSMFSSASTAEQSHGGSRNASEGRQHGQHSMWFRQRHADQRHSDTHNNGPARDGNGTRDQIAADRATKSGGTVFDSRWDQDKGGSGAAGRRRRQERETGALSSTVVGTMLAVTYERLFGKQSSKSKAAWAARVQKQHASLSRTSLFQLPHSNDQMYNNDRSAFRTAILTRGMHRGCKPLRAVDA